MSYNAAYTSSFQSLEGVAWRVDICLPDHEGDPAMISLDADSPVVIEWPETKVYDSVCSSICTVKVVNETDRQMIGLMANRMALCKIYRNGVLYWSGTLDDSVYEEPYSYRKNYVTEISFSDLGKLKRNLFQMTGFHSFHDVLSYILDSTDLGLLVLKELGIRLSESVPFSLGIMVNTDAFAKDGESNMYDALDRLLRPFGMRIDQRNGCFYLRDLDFLRDGLAIPVYWKGTDARIRGSETLGMFEIQANTRHSATLADLFMNLRVPEYILENGNYHALMKDLENDDIVSAYRVYPVPFFNNNQSKVLRGGVIETRPERIDYTDRFVFERAKIEKVTSYQGSLPLTSIETDLGYSSTANSESQAEPIIVIESGLMPLVPDKDGYMLRVNLDLLLAPQRVPAIDTEENDYNYPDSWPGYKFYQRIDRVSVYAKLEAVQEDGEIVMHYDNRFNGVWKTGPGKLGSFVIAYYNDDYTGTPLEDWATNRPYKRRDRVSYKDRTQGEYVPLPNCPCRLRLTVGNAVGSDNTQAVGQLSHFNEYIHWQAYKNASITIVNAGKTDKEEDADLRFEDLLDYQKDRYSEQVDLFLYEKGVSPAACGIITDAEYHAIVSFYWRGENHTLMEHRVRCLERQCSVIRPVLSGTIRLEPTGAVFSDSNIEGKFLRVGSIQDLQADTEEVTLLNITPDIPDAGGAEYSFAWSDPVCAQRPVPFRHAWSDPVCVLENVPDHYSHSWGDPICVYQNVEIGLEWEEL